MGTADKRSPWNVKTPPGGGGRRRRSFFLLLLLVLLLVGTAAATTASTTKEEDLSHELNHDIHKRQGEGRIIESQMTWGEEEYEEYDENTDIDIDIDNDDGSVCDLSNVFVAIKSGASSDVYKDRRQVWRNSQCARYYKDNGINYRFFLGIPLHQDLHPMSHNQGLRDTPEEIRDLASLKQEQADHNGDIVILPIRDIYDDLVIKTFHVFQWFLNNNKNRNNDLQHSTASGEDTIKNNKEGAAGKEILVHHDDEYCINLEELQQMCRNAKKNHASANLYGGHYLWQAEDTTNPEEYYSPYFSGNVYVMSRPLVEGIVNRNSILDGSHLVRSEDLRVGYWVDLQVQNEGMEVLYAEHPSLLIDAIVEEEDEEFPLSEENTVLLEDVMRNHDEGKNNLEVTSESQQATSVVMEQSSIISLSSVKKKDRRIRGVVGPRGGERKLHPNSSKSEGKSGKSESISTSSSSSKSSASKKSKKATAIITTAPPTTTSPPTTTAPPPVTTTPPPITTMAIVTTTLVPKRAIRKLESMNEDNYGSEVSAAKKKVPAFKTTAAPPPITTVAPVTTTLPPKRAVRRNLEPMNEDNYGSEVSAAKKKVPASKTTAAPPPITTVAPVTTTLPPKRAIRRNLEPMNEDNYGSEVSAAKKKVPAFKTTAAPPPITTVAPVTTTLPPKRAVRRNLEPMNEDNYGSEVSAAKKKVPASKTTAAPPPITTVAPVTTTLPPKRAVRRNLEPMNEDNYGSEVSAAKKKVPAFKTTAAPPPITTVAPVTTTLPPKRGIRRNLKCNDHLDCSGPRGSQKGDQQKIGIAKLELPTTSSQPTEDQEKTQPINYLIGEQHYMLRTKNTIIYHNKLQEKTKFDLISAASAAVGKDILNDEEAFQYDLSVDCGNNNYALTCSECPLLNELGNEEHEEGNEGAGCAGACQWNFAYETCEPKQPVSCGSHEAPNCEACSLGYGESWCNGECKWDNDLSICQPKGIRHHVHPAYYDLIKLPPFQPVKDENGNEVNIIFVRHMFFDEHHEKLYHKFKDDILFLGIMSYETFPYPSPNPYSFQFQDASNNKYLEMFPGWLNMYRKASGSNMFPSNVKVLDMSQSDFDLPNIDYDQEISQGQHLKRFDFGYAMSDLNVTSDDGYKCNSWGAFAKNWSFVRDDALDILCGDLGLTGVLVVTKDSNTGESCQIPPSCKGKIVQTPFISQEEIFDYMRQSRFWFLPQVYDASPRVATQAMTMNVPLLMNENIVGGWKYINEQTGEFFHDKSNFRTAVQRLMSNLDSYQPREYILNHYGNDIAGRKLKKFIEDNFGDRVDLPAESELLIPVFN